jgi:hypothetical protein
MPFALIFILNLILLSNDVLDKYLWKNRILLVFTPDFQDDRFQRQLVIFQNSEEKFEEREIIIIELGPDNANGKNLYGKNEVTSLRQKYNIGNSDFSVILIGKDGKEKSRYSEEVQAEQITSLIDSMPMGKEEMKNRR